LEAFTPAIEVGRRLDTTKADTLPLQ
jgi:hypothetical protein